MFGFRPERTGEDTTVDAEHQGLSTQDRMNEICHICISDTDIEERIADGVFRSVNPLIAAQGFMGMIGHSLLFHEIYGVKRPAGLLPEQIVDTFVALFCEGI